MLLTSINSRCGWYCLSLLIILCAITAHGQHPASFKNSTPFKTGPASSHSTVFSTPFPGYNYPVNDCFTYTYKMSVGDPAGQTVIRETFTALGGVSYIIGKSTEIGVAKGLLQEIGMTGDIAWTKTYSIAGRDLYFNSMRQLPDGMLMIIGTSSRSDQSDKKPFLAEIDLAGNIIWSKILDAPGYSGMFVSPSTANGVCFAAQDESTIIYGRMDYTGNMIWLKRAEVLDSGSLVGMVNDERNKWFIGYTGVQGAIAAGAVMSIAISDGNIDWTLKLGGTAVSQFIFHDMEIINLRPRILGIYSRNNGAFQLFKSTIHSGGYVEAIQFIQIPTVTITGTARSSLSPWGEVIAMSPGDTDPDMYVFKTVNETANDDRIAWKKNFPVPGIHELISAGRTFDGGFIIAANKLTGSTSQGYLLKTDSIGVINDCPGTSYSIASTTQLQPFFPTVYTNTENYAAPFLPVASEMSDEVFSFTHECKSLSCPPRPPEYPCVESFARRYRSASFGEAASDLILDENNNIILTGSSRENPYDYATRGAFLAKMDNAGKLINAKNIFIGKQTDFRTVLKWRDGNVATLGTGMYPSASGNDTPFIMISTFSAAFQLLWNRSFPVSDIGTAVNGIVESNDGSVFVHYVEGEALCGHMRVLKLKQDGSLEWIKNYEIPGSCVKGEIGSMTQDEDFIYLANYAVEEMVLTKISKQNGNMIWASAYSIPGVSQMEIARNLSILENDLVFQGKIPGPVPKNVIVVVDKDGNLKRHKTFTTVVSTGVLSMTVTKNNDLVFTGTNNVSGSFFYRLDKELNLLYSKQTEIPGGNTSANREGQDGGIYEVGTLLSENPYESELSIKKYSYDGLIGSCYSDTLVLREEVPVIDQRIRYPSAASVSVALSALPYRESTYSLQENELVCSNPAECFSVAVPDIAEVCDTLPFTITAIRNNGCNAPVYFEYEGEGVKLISETASSVTLQVMQSGAVTITAKMFTGCVWVEDEKTFHVMTVPKLLNLGNDSAICDGSTVVLNAGKGYSSYLWNNGSRDSSITINAPGIYYAEVTDICMAVQTDTVLITSSSPFPSRILPADTSICIHSELEIRPLGRFENYKWNNGSRTNTITVQFPGEYWLEVKDEKNCTARDTIIITGKDCIKGFRMPTAFSPNNDGKNDRLMPYFGEPVKYYRLKVFDRWGHLVFSTSDVTKGWNGEVNGRPQDSNGYVWSCVYQLEGREMRKETGMIMLLR